MTYTTKGARAYTRASAGSVKNGRYTYSAKDGDSSATKVVKWNGKGYRVNANIAG